MWIPRATQVVPKDSKNHLPDKVNVWEHDGILIIFLLGICSRLGLYLIGSHINSNFQRLQCSLDIRHQLYLQIFTITKDVARCTRTPLIIPWHHEWFTILLHPIHNYSRINPLPFCHLQNLPQHVRRKRSKVFRAQGAEPDSAGVRGGRLRHQVEGRLLLHTGIP